MLPLQEFRDFIQRNALFTKESKILLTVSGGKDSVLMVHLFKLLNLDFGIAHCNFNLRAEESHRDEAFVKMLAVTLDVPFYLTHFNTKKHASLNKVSTQMAARDLRYQWFEVIRQKHNYDVIATAHHQTDVVETVLLNLTRGTGISGLHGILPKRGHLIRPLLFLSRARIDELIDQNNLDYVEDSSNNSVDYARNKIRMKVLPSLRAINPSLEHTFQQNVQRFAETEMVLEQVVRDLRKEMLLTLEDGIHLPIDRLKQLQPQALLAYELLRPYGFSEPVVADVLKNLDHESGISFFSATHRLLVDRKYLILKPVLKEEQPAFALIHPHDERTEFHNQEVTMHYSDRIEFEALPSKAYVDALKLIYPLILRSWQPGDKFMPLGMRGFKKISDFFVDQKVPLTNKDQIPILVNGNGDLIWIAGMRQDNRYKVSASTKKVAIFELKNK
jgi:tRNA(Ile)-lysidine synthase